MSEKEDYLKKGENIERAGESVEGEKEEFWDGVWKYLEDEIFKVIFHFLRDPTGIIATFTLIGYFLAYLLKSSSYNYLGIPLEFIDIDIRNLIMVGIYSYVVAGVFFACFKLEIVNFKRVNLFRLPTKGNTEKVSWTRWLLNWFIVFMYFYMQGSFLFMVIEPKIHPKSFMVIEKGNQKYVVLDTLKDTMILAPFEYEDKNRKKFVLRRKNINSLI